MVLKNLKIGDAIIVLAKKGVNEPFCKGVRFGQKYIIAKIDKDTYVDFRILNGEDKK